MRTQTESIQFMTVTEVVLETIKNIVTVFISEQVGRKEDIYLMSVPKYSVSWGRGN